MAGLLDFGIEDPDQKQAANMGLLSLGLRLMSTPGKFGQALGQSGMGALGDYQDARQAIMRNKLQQAQLADFNQQAELRKAQADEMKRKADEAVRQRQILASAFGGVAPVDALNTLPPNSGPRPAALQNIGQRAPIDYQALIAQGLPADLVKSLAESRNYGKDKVARTIKGIGPDGKEYEYQVDDFGNKIGDGLAQYRAPIQVDQGNKKTFVDPYTNKPVSSFQTFLSPDAAASNALGYARLNFDKSQVGKPVFQEGQWITPPSDMKPGEARQVTGGNTVKDANDALALVKMARDLLPKSTGSYGGVALDHAARAVGYSTEGAQTAAKLNAIGGMLTSKMPKMSGPQSDKDVMMYREMAGKVGDATLPVAERLAALDAVEEIQMRYSSGQGGTPPNTNRSVANLKKPGSDVPPEIAAILKKHGGN